MVTYLVIVVTAAGRYVVAEHASRLAAEADAAQRRPAAGRAIVARLNAA